MSNSPLVDYVKLSPNYNPRNGTKISKITIHHVAGVATVEGLGDGFAVISRQASSNYGIGHDARVGQYVEEHNRAWTSSNADNDYQAVTIEVSNSATGGNWPVSDKVLNKLVDLCVDICKRNGIEKLNYTGNASGNLTMHKWFAPTACPGPYLESKFPWIAEEVNKRLEEDKPMTEADRAAFESLVNEVKLLKKEVSKVKVKYNKLEKCPEYGRPTISKLIGMGVLKGEADGNLKLTEQMIRELVILDRAGVFDKD